MLLIILAVSLSGLGMICSMIANTIECRQRRTGLRTAGAIQPTTTSRTGHLSRRHQLY
ncbi:hypothetical protein [Butyricicoccus sp. Marseille-Q5471]|uniref:hypothetical protein n=1 Tax=Butyricicoccus sp. Marseille-Q5471 TaxID=3039493 RepID=UPI0024BD0966|nr:hypothetical protein [Butyricicoccus sp. Marseille-Q5471]